MSTNEFQGMPSHVQNAPTTVWPDIPTDGILDPRWEEFEEKYREYVMQCVAEKSPDCLLAEHEIMVRFRTFFNTVLPKYEYNPDVERFRLFIRRFVHATVAHVQGKNVSMPDHAGTFNGTQKSCDNDLNDTFDEIVKEISRMIVLDSRKLTQEQRYIFKAIVFDHVTESEVYGRYGKQVADEAIELALALCDEVRKEVLRSGGPGFFDAA